MQYKDYNFIENGELDIATLNTQDTINLITAQDDYGRTIDLINGYKDDKDRYVGLFYFTWFGQHGGQQGGIYDITKLLNDNPNALWDKNYNDISPTGQYHYWGEPLYGYYDSTDPWVIRKQIELFCYAGIDFLIMDATNGFDYLQVAEVMLPIMQEYYEAGWPVPKIMYYLNSQSNNVLRLLYEGYQDKAPLNSGELKTNGIYKDGRYQNLWFKPNGKPLIVAITEENNRSAGWENGNNLMHRVVDQDLLNFFEFKESQWPNAAASADGFPWIDWTRPQNVYGTGEETIMNIGVAQHQKLPFSDALTADKTFNGEELADLMWGRGYTSEFGADRSDEAIRKGLNFEEQWQNAINSDPKYAFVTGWNEWAALKLTGAPGNDQYFINGNSERVFFVDTVNEEFSRDVEMMKGGYGDNVYLQLMRNIRNYKGNKTELNKGYTKTINIRDGLNQWKDVSSIYKDITNEINRNYKNICSSANYTDNSLINDITQVRVSSDNDNIYFLIETKDDMVIDLNKNNSMTLMIDIEGQNDKAFKGYNYIIGRNKTNNGTASVEKYIYDKGKINYSQMKNAQFTCKGRYMQIQISKNCLGINGDFRINFKVADNVTNMEDITNFYITGECAPVGRLNYAYKG